MRPEAKYTPAIHDSNHMFMTEVISYIASQADSRPARFNMLYEAFKPMVLMSHVTLMDIEIRKYADSLAKFPMETVDQVILLISDRERMSLAGLKDFVHSKFPELAAEEEAEVRLRQLSARASDLITQQELKNKSLEIEAYLKMIAEDSGSTDVVLEYLKNIDPRIHFATFQHYCNLALRNRGQVRLLNFYPALQQGPAKV